MELRLSEVAPSKANGFSVLIHDVDPSEKDA